MCIKHLDHHVVQTNENYIIRDCDKTIIVLAPDAGDGPIRLRLPRHPYRGQKLTIVAAEVDVLIDPAV
jgi:hypothetical protein